MSKVKDGNFVVIQSFMVKELKLKGNELIVYAIIYGFSQSENQCFSGSLSYLAEWTSATKQGIMKNLKSLIDKRLINKSEQFVNGVKFVEYRATQFNGGINKVYLIIKKIIKLMILKKKNIYTANLKMFFYPMKNTAKFKKKD